MCSRKWRRQTETPESNTDEGSGIRSRERLRGRRAPDSLPSVAARIWRFRGVCALALALASACVRKDETPVARGDREQILYTSIGPEPADLDPHKTTGLLEADILRSLGEGLVNLDSRDLHPTPAAAERWEISPDGLSYVFHLRPNLRWSDGAPLRAANFVAGFRRTLAPEVASELSYLLWPIRNAEPFNKNQLSDFSQVGVRAVDPQTVEITLERPTAWFLELLAQRMFYPEREDDNKAWPWMGNGAFVLKRWDHQRELVAEPNPYYWNAPAVRLHQIHFVELEDMQTEERAFRTGLVHKTARLPPGKIESYRREHPELLRIDPVLSVYYYLVNTARPPLADARVRRALAMSIDRRAIVEHVTHGGQQPAEAFTPPGTGGYTARAGIPFDPEGARRLLAEAGYPGGRDFPPVELLFNTNESHRLVAEAVQAMWKRELGIDVQILNQEWKVFLQSVSSGDFQIARASWAGAYLDPNTFLEIFLSGGSNNHSGFADARYDALLNEAAQTAEPAARLELFQEAEARLLEAVPVLPIYDYTHPYLMRPSVRGWTANALDYHLYQEVSLERDSARP